MGIETYKEVELDDSLVKTALALGIYIETKFKFVVKQYACLDILFF